MPFGRVRLAGRGRGAAVQLIVFVEVPQAVFGGLEQLLVIERREAGALAGQEQDLPLLGEKGLVLQRFLQRPAEEV